MLTSRPVACLAWFILSMIASAAPSTEPEGEPGLARALATAMLVHDRSVRSAEWTQRMWWSSVPVEERHVDAHWRLQGERFARSEHQFGTAPKRNYTDDLHFDGQWFTGWTDSSRSGSIREYQGDLTRGVAILAWIGRDLEGMERATLGELMLDAADLAFVGPDADGRPVIEATVPLEQYIALVQVTLDPEHGYAPREIVARDRLVRVPYRRYVTEEFTRVGDVWLPSKGILRTRYIQADPKDIERFGTLLQARGLSRENVLDGATQRAYLDVLREVWGTDEIPSAEMVADIHVEARYLQLNIPLDWPPAQPPPGYLMLDSTRDAVRPPGGEAWVENGPADPD